MKPVQKATTPTVPATIVASAVFSIYHLPVAPRPSRERSREAHSQDRPNESKKSGGKRAACRREILVCVNRLQRASACFQNTIVFR